MMSDDCVRRLNDKLWSQSQSHKQTSPTWSLNFLTGSGRLSQFGYADNGMNSLFPRSS